MKTTIDIAPAVLDGAKRLAKERGTTLRAVVERALRRELETAAGEQEPYEYKPVLIPIKSPPGIDLDDPAVLKRIYRYREEP